MANGDECRCCLHFQADGNDWVGSSFNPLSPREFRIDE